MEQLHTEYVDLGTVKMAFRQHGSGPTLLLLHGNSGSKRIFLPYQSKYFSDLHTVAIDSRGHGESQSVNIDFSIEQYADDVIALCKKMGIERAHVIGHSDGGNIGLFLACKAPEMFPRIIAISPNYLVSGTTERALRFFRFLISAARLLGNLGFKMNKAIGRFNLVMRDIGLSEDDLGKIRNQVDILYAERELIKEEHIKRISELIPRSRLFKISGCNHMSIVKNPRAIETMRNLLFRADAGSA